MFRPRGRRSAVVSVAAKRKTACRWLCSRAAVARTSQPPPPWRVLFFGTDDISLKTLSALHEEQKKGSAAVVSHLEVVCPPDKAGLVPVKKYALKHGLRIHQPTDLKQWQVPTPIVSQNTRSNEEGNSIDAFAPKRRDDSFDIAVVVSYGHFLPRSLLHALPFGGINMHPSLLPKYRGAAPIYHTILNNDKECGVSIIELHDRVFDAGRILKQVKKVVDPYSTYISLSNELAALGATNVLSTLSDYHRLLPQALSQQEQTTKAPKINPNMGVISWEGEARLRDSFELFTKWRAFGDTVGICTSFQDQTLRLNEVLPPFGYARSFDWNNEEEQKQRELPPPKFLLPKNKKEEEGEPVGSIRYDKKNQVLWIKCCYSNDDDEDASDESYSTSSSSSPSSSVHSSKDGDDADETWKQRLARQWIACSALQFWKKNRMRAVDFHNGYLVNQPDRKVWRFR
ncbi:Methionyl-tRNA formyltransferase [Balamuthia mandrillaris]